MSKYCCSLNVNICPKVDPWFINIATARPYTQEIKNSKKGRLPCKLFSFENIFNILTSIIFSTINEYNYNVSTDQIIRKPIYGFKVYAPEIAFSMLINFLSFLSKHYFYSIIRRIYSIIPW